MLDNIGLPYTGLNIAMSDTATIGQLRRRNPGFAAGRPATPPPGITSASCARRLDRQFPDLTFFFQPADIVGQILNFGLPAPIDVQVVGPLANAPANYALARQIERAPGAHSRRRGRAHCTRWWTFPSCASTWTARAPSNSA